MPPVEALADWTIGLPTMVWVAPAVSVIVSAEAADRLISDQSKYSFTSNEVAASSKAPVGRV